MRAKILPSLIRIVWRLVLSLILILYFVWCGFAFWFQLPGGKIAFLMIIILWAALGFFVIFGEWSTKWRWRTRFLALFSLLLFAAWWSTIRPSLDRDWDFALAHTVSGTIEGNIVHINNIRDFDWITEEQANQRWISETFDLTTIDGIDIYSSYWMGSLIAHTLVSFSFKDGRHLVFSAEIRREKGETFSAIGGFFKEFDLALIAATESDIIRLRTNIRKEHVYRYALNVPQERAQELLRLYIQSGNKLAKKAAFYNTLTTNCTTVVFQLARVFDPGLPVDWRILLSGQLPGYLYDHHFINTDLSLEQTVNNAHIGAEADGGAEGYSTRIRQKGQNILP